MRSTSDQETTISFYRGSDICRVYTFLSDRMIVLIEQKI